MIKGFKQINEKGFSNYYINKEGKVFKYKNDKIRFINERPDAYGYSRIRMVNDEGKAKDRKVHRLIAKTFIPNPENLPQVNHINGIKNDNRIENLEWCTASYNIKHMHKIVLKERGTDYRKCKLYFMGKYIKNFNKVIDACEYAQEKYKASYTSLQKYYTSNGCAIIFE